MTQAHTNGPWEVSFSQINAGKHECIVQFGFNIRENPKALANARLIAASPDMLEALELLIKDFADYPASERPCLAFDKAHAAIAKARGN